MVKYDEATKRRALQLRRRYRWGYKRIGEIIGCSHTTVKKWIIDAGLEKNPLPNHSEGIRKNSLAAIAGGLEVWRAARKYGVSESTLRRWMKEDGVVKSRRRFDHKTILAELRAGRCGADVAARHGCSESLVSKVKREG